jgi:hypothetical protein
MVPPVSRAGYQPNEGMSIVAATAAQVAGLAIRTVPANCSQPLLILATGRPLQRQAAAPTVGWNDLTIVPCRLSSRGGRPQGEGLEAEHIL